ncbi:thiamine phosphate synthase [Flammeovirga kamogawensis]|uniref:Thiamine phosphate synthase n=1 Tax=Flammeovirga kamogawensis TaxID=373891 RepID=A0ABX8GSW6_9BACT|nr:thiamine phosphate synthase [Flammeovirga kamogawensis]MBB6462959.1 thiamine-phosphate pyrophosphorylase [Flammeovirga kamogawensis]QWG06486.1 thiamine phosphate synthase [Flammeovirga kamogawensis]TRX68315.1 thiamine phosphate synthase [Flammeovirga kamogawensis]
MLIGITKEDFFTDEAQLICFWLDNGIDIIHIRKPNATKEEISTLLNVIPIIYHKKLTLNQHFDLTYQFNVGGIHFKESMRQATKLKNLEQWKSKGLRLSSSVHQMDEIPQIPTAFDYLFLSPVFDSTSKKKYKSNTMLLERMKKERFELHQIVALGGITDKSLLQLDRSSFKGAAILGYLWETSLSNIKLKAEKLQTSWKTIVLSP